MQEVPARFWTKVDRSGDCWVWTGAKYSNGYGIFYWHGKPRPVHRVSHEMFKGPIPDGLTIDHLCRNHACCNPDHLEAVTKRENTLRGIGPAAQHARQTHCKHGHTLSGDNLLVLRSKPSERRCRICARNRANASRAIHKDKYNARQRAMRQPKERRSTKGIPHGPMSEATKEKLRQARLGTKASPEARAKMSEGQLRRAQKSA